MPSLNLPTLDGRIESYSVAGVPRSYALPSAPFQSYSLFGRACRRRSTCE